MYDNKTQAFFNPVDAKRRQMQDGHYGITKDAGNRVLSKRG